MCPDCPRCQGIVASVLLRRAAERPLIVVVSDNRAADDFIPILQAFANSPALDPESIISLPARDVLPFQNLSPHPEIQEERATALWKIASGSASIVVVPVSAATILLRAPSTTSIWHARFRRGESLDVEGLLRHLNTVGYVSTDVVEMPGQYALARRDSRCVLARSRPSAAH